MKVIGLTGKAGAGKDFVGSLIRSQHGHWIDEYDYESRTIETVGNSVELASFAGPLKDTVAAMFCIDRELMNTDEGKRSNTHWRWDDVLPRCHPDFTQTNHDVPVRLTTSKRGDFITVRELLQFVGTDLVRDCWNPQHWIQCAGQRMAKSAADIYVFTDCRFQNEAAFVRSNGGEVWEVAGRQHEHVPQHVSETRDFQADYTIDNSPGTTVEQLVRQINERLEVVKG